MIRRHVLAALAVGVEAGDDAAAREALLATEWVLRGPARRRLDRALIDAAYLTGEGFTTVDIETMRHLQRVAALDVAGKNDIDLTDRAAVARTYYEIEAPPPPRVPLAAILLGSGLAIATLLFALLAITVRAPIHHERRHIAMPGGAFVDGGVPLADPALAAFLRDELTDLVIETDADRRGSHEGAARASHLADLRKAPVMHQYGPSLARSWGALLDSLDRWTEVSIHAAKFHDAITELGLRAQELSEQLAALGIGYYVSADVMVQAGTARAVVFSYRVEDVAFVRAGGDAYRVLSLRRLDKLNLELALLGLQNDELGDPVVMLDRVDELVTDRVLPVLDGETYRFGDPGWRRGTTSGRMIASAAADGVSRELFTLLRGVDRDARVPIVERIVTACVRRHEARHAIDIDRTRPLRYPERLAAIAGPRDGSTARAQLELAGYLSQIANEPYIPQFALWNVAGHAFNVHWGSAESYVAVVILEGLARQLGHTPDHPIVIAAHLDRDALAALARPLAYESGENIRAAARLLWIELYGEPLLPIVDVPAPSPLATL